MLIDPVSSTILDTLSKDSPESLKNFGEKYGEHVFLVDTALPCGRSFLRGERVWRLDGQWVCGPFWHPKDLDE